MRTLCPVIINPGYEAPEARVHASRVTCEAGVCLGKSRFGYGSALGEGISRDPLASGVPLLRMSPSEPNLSTGIGELSVGPNLYDYVLNRPIYETDPTGLLSPGYQIVEVAETVVEDIGTGLDFAVTGLVAVLVPTTANAPEIPQDNQAWMGSLNSQMRKFRLDEDACLAALEKFEDSCKSSNQHPFTAKEREDFMNNCMEGKGWGGWSPPSLPQ